MEYGSASDPEQLGWLLAYSPYHHVVPGTAYPAVLFTVFTNDTRVDPVHAYKMCAALQYAGAGPRLAPGGRCCSGPRTRWGTGPGRSAGWPGWPGTRWRSPRTTPDSRL